jgi:tetratricopeptide (TPR) repeat protein
MPRPVPAGWALMAALALGAWTVGMDAQAPEINRLFATANALYAEQRYAEAVEVYRAVLSADPSRGEARFFLANALDNLFVPARRGQPANDRLLEDARTHYATAATLLVGPQQVVLLKRTLQFLTALYGPDKLNRPDEAEAVVRQLVALDPSDISSYFGLARIHEEAGRLADAEAVLLQAQAAAPEQASVWSQTAQFFNRQDRFDEAMTAFAHLTRLDPADPQPFYQMAVFYEEKVRKDAPLPSAQQAHYLTAGMEAVDRALALRPDYFEALVYKNLLLRHQARFAPDPLAQRLMHEEADRLQRQAIALRDRQAGSRRLP